MTRRPIFASPICLQLGDGSVARVPRDGTVWGRAEVEPQSFNRRDRHCGGEIDCALIENDYAFRRLVLT
jgi:hypothetical protein